MGFVQSISVEQKHLSHAGTGNTATISSMLDNGFIVVWGLGIVCLRNVEFVYDNVNVSVRRRGSVSHS